MFVLSNICSVKCPCLIVKISGWSFISMEKICVYLWVLNIDDHPKPINSPFWDIRLMYCRYKAPQLLILFPKDKLTTLLVTLGYDSNSKRDARARDASGNCKCVGHYGLSGNDTKQTLGWVGRQGGCAHSLPETIVNRACKSAGVRSVSALRAIARISKSWRPLKVPPTYRELRLQNTNKLVETIRKSWANSAWLLRTVEHLALQRNWATDQQTDGLISSSKCARGSK